MPSVTLAIGETQWQHCDNCRQAMCNTTFSRGWCSNETEVCQHCLVVGFEWTYFESKVCNVHWDVQFSLLLNLYRWNY